AQDDSSTASHDVRSSILLSSVLSDRPRMEGGSDANGSIGRSYASPYDQRRGQSWSVNREETVRNRRFPEGRKKQRPVHGLDTADPCEQRPQSRIMDLRHRLRVGDRRAPPPPSPLPHHVP